MAETMRLGAVHTQPPAHVPLLTARARLDLMTAPAAVGWHKAPKWSKPQ